MRRPNPFVPVLLLSLYPTLLASRSLPASDQNTQTEVLTSQARDLIKEGNLPAAEVELRKAADLVPNDPGVLGDLGNCPGDGEKV